MPLDASWLIPLIETFYRLGLARTLCKLNTHTQRVKNKGIGSRKFVSHFNHVGDT